MWCSGKKEEALGKKEMGGGQDRVRGWALELGDGCAGLWVKDGVK